jgi:hypothetical protein
VVPAVCGYTASSHFSDGVDLHFASRLMADLTLAVDYRLPEISLVFCIRIDGILLPIPFKHVAGMWSSLASALMLILRGLTTSSKIVRPGCISSKGATAARSCVPR